MHSGKTPAPWHRYLEEAVAPRQRAIAAGQYPAQLLSDLGRLGALGDPTQDPAEWERQRFLLIEAVAALSLSAAFVVWCHTATMAYLAAGANPALRQALLPQLAAGEVAGATGLSNAMKFYAGLEPLRLQATPTRTGWRICGRLPAVSNLTRDGWMAVVAAISPEQRLLALIPTAAASVKVQERRPFVALNGTATYAVTFEGVEVPREWVVHECADAVVKAIRPAFVWTQSAMAFGAAEDLIGRLGRMADRWCGWEDFEWPGWGTVAEAMRVLRDATWELGRKDPLDPSPAHWQQVLTTRARAAWHLLDLARHAMVGLGAGGYCAGSYGATRLLEAYFLSVVTPSLKHLALELHRLRQAAEPARAPVATGLMRPAAAKWAREISGAPGR
ncbi:MAG: acyl-CoA dehydrogenase family protein [Firmicutes bacterium]|nr:acyl-CoA/acyl-ACP dehydrogenase [Alicyclobacillaceae bacterium]MCL6496280.1 acyl-CoA dehydrogenase family protein [Bacillota bacterium]